MTAHARLSVTIALLLAAPASAATVSPLDLVWHAPVGCPDAEMVRAEILRLAGGRGQGGHRLQARAIIQSDLPQGWRLHLTTESNGERGERTLSDASCQSLSDAAVVMLALLLNPEVVRPPPTTSSMKDQDGRRRKGPRWQLGMHAGLQAGVLDQLSPAFALSLSIGVGRWSVRLVPGFSPPQDITVAGQPSVGGRVWSGTAGLLGCWAALDGRAHLAPCLGWELARAEGRGRGIEQTQAEAVYWSAAELAMLLGYQVRSVTLELSTSALVPVHRPSLFLDDIGTVTRPASVDLRVLAGIVLAPR